MTKREIKLKGLELALLYLAALPDSERLRRWKECGENEDGYHGAVDDLRETFENMIAVSPGS